MLSCLTTASVVLADDYASVTSPNNQLGAQQDPQYAAPIREPLNKEFMQSDSEKLQNNWGVNVASATTTAATTEALPSNVVSLVSVQTRSAPGNKAQILLEFTGPVAEPGGFALNDPTQMIFDFPGVNNALSAKEDKQKVSLGVMTGLNFVDSGKITRLIIDVINIVPYHVDIDRDKIIITLDNDVKTTPSPGDYTISALDFRRGDAGEGRVIISYSGEKVPVNFKENAGDLVVEFVGATIPDALLRKYDVKDFATNITSVTVDRQKDNVFVTIGTTGNFENIAYQLDKEFIVEVRPETDSSSALKSQKFRFTGQKISLNFQDIEIRAVLQIIAEFVGMNVIINDAVRGTVTLHLENVPWDQALDYIMSTNGLSKRESGDITVIAPSALLASQEQADLEAQQQTQSLAPLESEYVQINYAKASDMVNILKATDNSLLSARGQISVDSRTNTLLIKDTAANIAKIKDLLAHLDVPVRQVVIETQLVDAREQLKDELGLSMNGAATAQLGKYTLGAAPTAHEAFTYAENPASKTLVEGESFFDFILDNVTGKSTLGLALAHLPGGTLLDLELRASESEQISKTIARPKILTLDQQQASIETGEEIPFTTTSQQGATPTTTFKKAVLKLDVTPQITPNDKIGLALTINQDSQGAPVNGQVAINTTSITTNVLVDNGDTIVLGGIFKLTDTSTVKAVPYLSEIPVLGRLFSTNGHSIDRTEILIFVTPRIAKSLLDH